MLSLPILFTTICTAAVIGPVNPNRFVQIDLFLRELIVVHDHRDVVRPVLVIGLAQRKGDRTLALK